ncbi:Alpha-L-arabinofuranosidase, C-terminal [Kalmanozyma brasiliensis GHG001]|uniref:non-reducing end alpha-L-arabinofuranosidase n=1 Tax=Kalmanozyma brasiliensis (strain GHG001) TaxID=1365824 RepID=V5GWF7_KALBG|nr:Alpha-L-arabinofuranosidase, C-terminal [Kalmanozyma brasiliensis GHG001]EST10227.1 Alpha-L-arabinofuranosidase, C-terminal [Kalmanozyma brasiliensis GHG001]
MKSLSLSWVTMALATSIFSISSVSAAPAATTSNANAASTSPAVTYNVAGKPSRVSHFGLGAFIETNINSGTDGGLYAEIIRNRAFQDNVNNQANQNDALGKGSLLHWSGTSQSTKLSLSPDNALSSALPQSAVVSGDRNQSCGIANPGWYGISVTTQPHQLSFYARSPTGQATTVPVKIGLYSNDYSKTYTEQTMPLKLTGEWQKFETTLTPSQASSNNNNVFAIKTTGACRDGFQVNLVSLLPPTYEGTVARQDLAQALADIKPVYVRLPGGNDLEGNNIPSWFNWTNAVGDLKNRPGRTPTWTSGWNTEGLGLMELMDLAEKWGAQAVLGIYAGYSLNGEAVPKSQLGPYIQSALNQLHFLLDTSGSWAELRSSYGRSEPYKFDQIEIGNEDWLGAAINTYGAYRWAAFRDAIAKEFPQLTLIASTLKNGVEGAKAVDDHMYSTPNQLFEFTEGMDSTSRDVPIWELEIAVINSGLTNDTDIYSGPGRLQHPTLIGALAEAAFLAGAERNGDIFYSAAYAPIFQNEGPNATQWTPDMLSFNAGQMVKSTSYYIQYAWGNYPIKQIHDASPSTPTNSSHIYHSFGSNSQGALVAKLVNANAEQRTVKVQVGNGSKLSSSGATSWQMQGKNPQQANTLSNPNAIVPQSSSSGLPKGASLGSDGSLTMTLPPYSATVVTLPLA